MNQNADKVRALDSAELAKQLTESAEQTFRIKFQMGMGQMDGLKKLRELRKDRARMLTIQRERALGKSPEPAVAAKPGAKKKAAPRKKKAE